MSELPSILSYHPTYIVTGAGDGVQLIHATLSDFMLPEEFVNSAVGVLQRLGHRVRTVGDLVCWLQRLTPEDKLALRQAGVLDVAVSGKDDPVPEGKPYTRVWSCREPVDDIRRVAVDLSRMYQPTRAGTHITAPILGKQVLED